MMHVECPWCAGQATIEVADRHTFVCAGCSIEVEMAPEPTVAPMAVAA